jgi:hypothetical protein
MAFAPMPGLTRRVLLLGGIVACVVALAIGIGEAVAADQRLDEADLALQKAAALLEASQAGVVTEKQQRQFDRAVAKALDAVAEARTQIAEAKAAVDNP